MRLHSFAEKTGPVVNLVYYQFSTHRNVFQELSQNSVKELDLYIYSIYDM